MHTRTHTRRENSRCNKSSKYERKEEEHLNTNRLFTAYSGNSCGRRFLTKQYRYENLSPCDYSCYWLLLLLLSSNIFLSTLATPHTSCKIFSLIWQQICVWRISFNVPIHPLRVASEKFRSEHATVKMVFVERWCFVDDRLFNCFICHLIYVFVLSRVIALKICFN